ncbi:ABC-2 type transport system permease protein [Motilibacter rhizosphaerae]|uniref:ABC-2 type transport system permease protein n=1 Tax=Motilibacter rhizosphaerae TaxID=598652 RepID=A0A4V2F4R5_9ACTN|nr:ABC transporter permease [Motilibacter rhizosphaerae]RZS90239.1 ABC-2 type transport system permease protein [Motilibacter rhizosphaerae]
MTSTSPEAVIHDVRYSRWEGEPRPRWTAVVALARSSALRSLGIRRSAGAKVWPFILVAAAYAPAVVVVGVPLILRTTSTSPTGLLSYYSMLGIIGTTLLLAYTASTIPNMLTRERRDRVLSLYFSTALSPAEYLVAKVLAALSLLLLVTAGPLLLEFLGAVLTAAHPVSYVQHHVLDVPRVLLGALLLVLFHGLAALALGSLTPKRTFALAGYVAFILVPAVLGGVLFGITGSRDCLALILVRVPIWLARPVLHGTDGGDLAPSSPALWIAWLLVVGVSSTVLVLRYRKGAGA